MARRDSLSLSATLSPSLPVGDTKKVKPEGNDYLQKTYHNWTKVNELQRPCFKQDTKANQRWLKAM